MEYAVETLSLIVKPLNAPIYSELATTVTVEDESGGPFIIVSQADTEIRLDPDEWPAVKSAIDGLMNRLQWHQAADPDDDDEDEVAEDADDEEEEERPDEWLCSDYKHSGDPEPEEGLRYTTTPHF